MKIIDLTHSLSESSPVYPGKTAFFRKICASYEEGYAAIDIHICSGIGTHMDAPTHFYRDKNRIDTILLEQCYGQACVIHLADKIKDDADYQISAEDLLEWEKKNGSITTDSMVLADTGWARYYDHSKYLSLDEKKICHFPGYAEEAAQLLADRKVKGVGIDTLSIDPGNAAKFVAHLALLRENIFLIENLANLEKLPSKGAEVWMVPMKIENAPEAPIRAFALL